MSRRNQAVSALSSRGVFAVDIEIRIWHIPAHGLSSHTHTLAQPPAGGHSDRSLPGGWPGFLEES